MQIKIVVATHKKYQMPSDDIYIPVQVGRDITDNIVSEYYGDNTGENISNKNKNFCELTCLYWAWKNVSADYIGLSHYRRHFKGNNKRDKWSCIASKKYIQDILNKTPVILPKKRNYYIETTYQQYIHAHHKIDLDKTEEILKEFYPDYIQFYNKVMKSTKGHRFNMMIMRKDIFSDYCEWLFDILFKLEKRLDISLYSDYDKRVFGFISERLLDVWISKNNISYEEVSVINMENQNWIKKGTNFLKRKFTYKENN